MSAILNLGLGSGLFANGFLKLEHLSDELKGTIQTWLQKGEQGEKGSTGATGAQGVGIAGATINGAFHLILTLTDGTTIDAGAVK